MTEDVGAAINDGRRRDPECATLFLDFDGVLHPDEVYCVRGQIILKMDGFDLFEWSPILEELLAPYPDLQIVLSTSWVRVVGFDEACARLTKPLRQRVAGATWYRHGSIRGWEHLTRYEQILRNVEHHAHSRWLAIDDDGVGWQQEHRDRLVLTDSLLGLGATSAQHELREKLASLHP